jgi:hypothetical protein
MTPYGMATIAANRAGRRHSCNLCRRLAERRRKLVHARRSAQAAPPATAAGFQPGARNAR